MTPPLPLGLAEQIEALKARGVFASGHVLSTPAAQHLRDKSIDETLALCAEAWGKREVEQAARIEALEINLGRSDAALLDFYQQLADAKAKVELKRSAPALIAASRRAALQEKK